MGGGICFSYKKKTLFKYEIVISLNIGNYHTSQSLQIPSIPIGIHGLSLSQDILAPRL